jgi:uncharacterized OsmC-like protein
MDGDERIREALERSVKAVTLRPAIARRTGVTRATLKPGLACEVEDGPFKISVGMGPSTGGTGEHPGPGTLGRGALASCLTLGYAMWAARLGVPLDGVQVEVEADYDSQGELGISDDVPPGYTAVRYTVTVESAAPEADVLRVIDTADRYSPYYDVFTRANDLQRKVVVTAPR